MQKLISALLLVALSTATSVGAASVDPRAYLVEASPTDCVNTYIIKMVVAASRQGRAYGVYEDQEYFLERQGTPNHCSIDMATVSAGKMVERKLLKCLFNNPFDQ